MTERKASAKANTEVSPLRRKERAFGRDDKICGGEREKQKQLQKQKRVLHCVQDDKFLGCFGDGEVTGYWLSSSAVTTVPWW
jgi:hypothetical protein